jgi:cell division protease FtsH
LSFGAAILILLLGYLAVLNFSKPHVGGDTLRFDTFVAAAQAGNVKSVTILDQDDYVTGTYVRANGTQGRYNTPLIQGSQQQVLDLLFQTQVPVTVDQQVGKRVASLAALLLPGLIVVLLLAYVILAHRFGKGPFKVSSGARRFAAGESGVTFADVAGQEAAVRDLREIKDFLTDPGRFASLGGAVPRGVLLYGSPGCGKTLLARALAGEAGAAFYSISGSDFVQMYAGVGAARVRDLFEDARANAPAIIFIDELDSIGRTRASAGALAGHGEQEQGLNQILAEMDGFSTTAGVVVVAATNRPDVLDPALLRPGRFDRTVGLERPDEAARLAIVELHSQGKRLDADVDLAGLAHRAIGLTGADLASVMNEGALIAGRRGAEAIAQSDLDTALVWLLEAPERQRRLSLRERSIGRRFAHDERVTFADVAGADQAVEELADVRDYLADPDRFAAMGARAPRGILLSGPPGCGKTLLARAVAGEANAAFVSVAASEFVEVFAGEGASRVRELFAEARAMAPAIVFVDEIDAVGAHRGSWAGGQGERDQTLNQILVELDGFSTDTGIIVMAATNRPDLLDSALVRPGRFDRRVALTVPDRAGRRAILSLHARDKPLAPDVDLDVVAGLTRGFSGADLANVLNEAALLAVRGGHGSVAMSLVEEAVDRAMLGLASRGEALSDDERRTVAYHEAGHALVALALPEAMPHRKLTIAARGGVLGHCVALDTHDRVVHSRSWLIDHLTVLLGGRAAEELFSGNPISGSAGDLSSAVEIARQMVCDFGMSDVVGPAGRVDSGVNGLPVVSPEAARAIDGEIRRLVADAHERALRLLRAWREALDRVSGALLERETLTGAELASLAGAPPAVRLVSDAGGSGGKAASDPARR